MSFFKEFKEFAMKGNVIDLAVGVVIGGAFQGIVNSLVKDIIMPITGIFTGNVDYSKWVITLANGNVQIGIGSFINAIINFLIIALSIFIALKYINKLNKKIEKLNEEARHKILKEKNKKEELVEPTEKTCPYCLSEIPYKAIKCAHCGSDLRVKIENIEKAQESEKVEN